MTEKWFVYSIYPNLFGKLSTANAFKLNSGELIDTSKHNGKITDIYLLFDEQFHTHFYWSYSACNFPLRVCYS